MVDEFYFERLYTKKEFEEYLNQICEKKKVSVSYTVCDKLGNVYTYGQRAEKEANQSKKVVLSTGYDVKIEIWQDSSNVEIGDFESLFFAYWNKACCDKTTGFPTTEQTEMLSKCNNTLKFYYEHNRSVALIMMDLDHFKEVNDSNNHDVGSKVLGEFSQLLFSIFAEYGIMIHQTGDEFNVLFPYEDMIDVVNIVETVKKARDKIKNHDFDYANEISLSMAVGIKCIEDELLDFVDARNMAEKVYNNSEKRNSPKQRDSIRIDGGESSLCGQINLKLAWTRLVCNLDCAISGNVFLEYIKRCTETIAEKDEFQKKLDEILDWINPEYTSSLRYTVENIRMDTTEKFSKLELCLAIAQGMLKNKNFMHNDIIFNAHGNKLVVQMDDVVVFECEQNSSIEDFVGKCNSYYRNHCSKGCKRALLVKAGYDESSILEDIFYKVIRVDTRPTTGGGLPDFWAATLCELITIMKASPIVSDILIFGNVQYTRNIIELLQSIDKWDTHEKYNFKYIAQKTFKSIEDIRAFRDKFHNKIFVCENKESLINRAYNIYKEEIEENINAKITKSMTPRRMIKRDLSYGEIALDICDGCRVKTIADAYPIVLEILRHQKEHVQYNIKDQAGRELLELTDFKIVLSAPKSDELPDYYASDEQLLQEYYDKILGDNKSLFRKKLLEGEQFGALIKHVVQAIGGQNKYATRRAVLVVSNTVEDEDNFSPLGLISIWIAPRFTENHVVLDYSYNWRTVEAVVGLPLSMYASVKFAEEITDLIKKKIVQSESGITMGTVSYIAHSLHMFLDNESMDIVRGIVNDASI